MRSLKPATLAAATGLLLLAACHSSPEAASVENKADLLARDLEQQADNMDAMADAMANETAAADVRNAADTIDDAAHDVRDQADAKIANMQ